MYKFYGLTGKLIKVKARKPNPDMHPWGTLTVPVLITGEYRTFLRGIVQPHRIEGSNGLSLPYPLTLCKHHIKIGDLIINGGTIK